MNSAASFSPVMSSRVFVHANAYATPARAGHALGARSASHLNIAARKASPSLQAFRTREPTTSRGFSRKTYTGATASETLYDMPISNNGARVRLVIYWKGLENNVTITSPAVIGGLKSDEYLALNPQGKMPVLVLDDDQALPESEVITQYLVDKYADVGPSLRPGTPEQRAKANLATRIHDFYITSIQGVMYRGPMPLKDRAEGIKAISQQLQILEDICEAGPYFVGDQPSTADAALFPTFVFMAFILPCKFGWDDVFAGKPKLKAWYQHMKVDGCGARVYEEVHSALEEWDKSGRWEKVGITKDTEDTNHVW
eukprot:CAMPEP_0198211934 /NCGR_PEP_ID=MMETSP1445-20131203/25428_1 /TAXON_ID=36898 /ORGANISM="Pyramimonas sp., Strain CCMP2087" /LENGTH=312 /DNA_ID=CAMNT_0043886295 /DNA_START=55 /DNA_END=990 /DNA_ORIENTATION=+